jgi:hypothetical protein
MSPVTHQQEMYYPRWKRAIRQLLSIVIMTSLLSVAVAFMFLSLNLQVQQWRYLFFYDMMFEDDYNLFVFCFVLFRGMFQGYVHEDSMFYVPSLAGKFDPNGYFTLLPTIFHSMVIFVLNQVCGRTNKFEGDKKIFSIMTHILICANQMVYRKVAVFLTSFENYRTHREFENAILLKRVVIECFDCYLPLFYICFHGKSLKQLRMELIGLFLGDVIRRVATETILPLLYQKARRVANFTPCTSTVYLLTRHKSSQLFVKRSFLHFILGFLSPVAKLLELILAKSRNRSPGTNHWTIFSKMNMKNSMIIWK